MISLRSWTWNTAGPSERGMWIRSSEQTTCQICNSPLSIQWSDTHGVGACVTCGLPYRVIHYEDRDGKNVRVDKPPEVAVREDWLPLAVEYWNETHRRVFPASFDIGMGSRHDGRSYSGASKDDVGTWVAWLEARKDQWPNAA